MSSTPEKPTAEENDVLASAGHSLRAQGGDHHDHAERGIIVTDGLGRPLVEFDHTAERRLRTKLDLYIIPTVALLYLFCFIDRANIGNAKLAGMDVELGLVGYEWNTVLSLFYVSYTLFEIPSNIACKWLGPGWFIPGITLGFGVLTVSTAFVRTKAQAGAVRFLLGIFEAGVMPGIAYYLSRWYRRSELSFRLALYMIMAPLAGAFGSLLASAILGMDRFGAVSGWRMIFAIEGLVTVLLSLLAFLAMTDRPETARFLSRAEKELCLARVRAERVGASAVLDGLDTTKLVRGILNPATLPVALCFLLNNVTVQGLAFFLPTVVATIYPRERGYTVVQQQLYTAPPYVVGAACLVLACALAWRLDRRAVFLALSAPPVAAGYVVFLATGVGQARARYGATFLVASSAFFLGPLCNAVVSAAVVSDSARAAAIGTNVMLGNLGGLVATWSFLPFDAPDYRIGNGLNLAASSAILLVSAAMIWWMKRDNKRRDGVDAGRMLDGLGPREIEDLDWKNPLFRWRP